METEPPSKTSSGGLSCYAHGTSAQERAVGKGSAGDSRGDMRKSFKTSMKAHKGKMDKDKGGKQAQRSKGSSKYVDSLMKVMEQLAGLEMDHEDAELDSTPTTTTIRKRRRKDTEKGKKHGILDLIKQQQNHKQEQQHGQGQREVSGQQQQQEGGEPEGDQVARTTSMQWRGHLGP